MVVVETGMGNVGAGTEVVRAIDFIGPDLTLFVGVAGGVKDVRVGDVLVGDKVYYTESGKAVTRGTGDSSRILFEPRPEADRGDYRLVQLAKSVAARGCGRTAQERIRTLPLPSRTPASKSDRSLLERR